jgi:hypothetical protein
MDRGDSGPRAGTKAAPSYAADPSGILTPQGLEAACAHVWRDANSTVMLGADILSSEPVSYDDAEALAALRRHVKAAGRKSLLEDVLPRLRFGPPAKSSVGEAETR